MINLSEAISALSKGEIIVYPTDTLYGLGADIFNDNAVKKIFKIKKRPTNIPISIAVSNILELEKIANVDERTRLIVKHFLPGKLTLILEKKDFISDIITSNSKKVAIRIPNNKIALSLLKQFGPLTCTSANIHGKDTPTVIKDINMQFTKKEIALYLDDGEIKGKPSTIIDMSIKNPKIIREGDIFKKEILEVLKNG